MIAQNDEGPPTLVKYWFYPKPQAFPKPNQTFTRAIPHHKMVSYSFFNPDFQQFICGIFPATVGALTEEMLILVVSDLLEQGSDSLRMFTDGIVFT